MTRRWFSILATTLLVQAVGCAVSTRRAVRVAAAEVDPAVVTATHHPHEAPPPPPTILMPMSVATERSQPPGELNGPQPVEVYIQRALAENRTVQAAFHNVQSLRYRIPQVTVLDDPVVSNTIFPIPSVAPQYSLMGYNPYNMTLAQQFPWYGTLRLRGEAAEQDVKVALAELAAAQLDTVAAVKRSYFDLFVSQRTVEILAENRKVLEDFRAIAKSRLTTGGTQQDLIRSDVLISQLDREMANNEQAVASARSALARQIHVSPESDLRTLADVAIGTVPAEVDRLNQMAIAARPELRGRLAAIARDEKAVALAHKRFYPNLTLGLSYMDMEKTNAQTPKTAGGMPNIGLYVGFNLPVYRNKYRAGVCEAKERAAADSKLYEAQRDETFAEIKDFMTQARVQQNVLSLLRDSILPRTKDTLNLSRSDYSKSNVDYATVLSAVREVLQIELQIVQIEGEMGKALASLERAVGTQINTEPVTPPIALPPPPPPPSTASSPFVPPTPTGPSTGRR